MSYNHQFGNGGGIISYGLSFTQIPIISRNLIEENYTNAEQKLELAQPEYMYSSIMDYHGKVNGDWHGLGLYDNAAMRRFKPEDFYDDSFMKELEQSGFIASLYQ